MNKVLVDANVLSGYFGRNSSLRDSVESELAEELLEMNALAVSGHVYQEVLYGIRKGQSGMYQKIKRELDACVAVPTRKEYELAVEVSRKCTTNGIQMSIADLMDCALSASRGWKILTSDKDHHRAGVFDDRIRFL